MNLPNEGAEGGGRNLVATLTDLAGRLNFALCGQAAALAAAGGRRDGGRLPALIAMSDAERMPDPVAAALALPKGSAIILRHYEMDASARHDLAVALVRACRPRNVRVLIGDDPSLARAIGAAGVHLPEHSVQRGRSLWRLWRRPDWLVTAAAHSPAAMARARQAGVDAILLSPVFATKSHPDARSLGVLRFTGFCRASPLPVYALGGISAPTVRFLRGSGAMGIAAIGGIVGDS